MTNFDDNFDFALPFYHMAKAMQRNHVKPGDVFMGSINTADALCAVWGVKRNSLAWKCAQIGAYDVILNAGGKNVGITVDANGIIIKGPVK